MQRVFGIFRANLKIVGAAFLCVVLSAATSFMVARASIPASDGTIYACRNNTTTMLRVIDSVSQSCDANETVISWDQKGVKAYAHLTMGSQGYILDSAHSYNVTNYYSSYGTGGPVMMACLTVASTPNTVAVTSSSIASTLDTAIKNESGWTSTAAATACDVAAPTANVYVQSSASQLFISVF